MLDLKERFLARSGRTVYEPEQAAYKLATEGGLLGHERVFQSTDAKKFEYVFGEKIIFNDIEDEPELCDVIDDGSCFEYIVDILQEKPRFKDNERYIQRVETELKFFNRTNNVKFLIKLNDLIDSFKRDGVVWGVGRGSSCASLVLYILEIHDIDPIDFEIPFIELSKTDEDDYT